MPYWLIYKQCEDCGEESCLQCRRVDRRLTLRVIKADEMPEAALNGPCATSEELLQRIGQYFNFDQVTGIMHFKVNLHE